MADHLTEGLAHVNAAVKYDQQGLYKEACSSYGLALSHLKLALLTETDLQRRSLIAQKIEEYQERTSHLKQLLPSVSMATLSPPTSILSQLPIVAPSSFLGQLPIVVDPLSRLKPAAEMSRSEAFQTAVELSERAKQEDSLRNYSKALSLYETALDYYLASFKAEPSPDMKKNISDRMKLYLDRAEQLKPIVQQQNRNSTSTPQRTSIISQPSASSLNQLPTNLPGLSSQATPGMCASCGGLLIGSSLSALERQWHPECFASTVMCASCFKPFSLANLRYKVKDGSPYHPLCFEGTTGLTKEDIRTFIGTNSIVKFTVELPRKFFAPGEQFQFHFKIENQTTKKVNKVVTYLFKTETFMETVGTSFERKARRTETKLGRTEFFDSNFPLIRTSFEGDFIFLIPSAVFPSEVTGIDASFVREYELVVKCVLTRPLKDVKIVFGVNIQAPS